MRRRLVTLTFAALAALASGHAAAAPSSSDDAASAAAPVAVQRVNVADLQLRDEAAMVLVGTALIGLAAAVRRAA